MFETYRRILHIDMDAFYASVEQRDNPEWKGKPVIVGGLPESRRGVVCTASYEARKFGVRSAMPTKMAWQLCPEAVFVVPNFSKYKQVSKEIHGIFLEYTDLVQPLSLDEAFLDVTMLFRDGETATRLAAEILRKILQKTGLTASAGVSFNKFLAKIASGEKKPFGLTVIPPSTALEFVARLPIEKFWGVGKVTAVKFHKLGVHNGLDLRQLELNDLLRTFGKSGESFYNMARAEDASEVKPDRKRKSLSVEHTFESNLIVSQELHRAFELLTRELLKRSQNRALRAKTLAVKIRYADFSVQTHSAPVSNIFFENKDSALAKVMRLFYEVYQAGTPVRLLGLHLSNFVETNQEDLFSL